MTNATDHSADANAEQGEPMMDMHDSSIEDKLAGMVAQTRVDLGDEEHARVDEVLRQRLRDSGIEISDKRRAALAHEVLGTSLE